MRRLGKWERALQPILKLHAAYPESPIYLQRMAEIYDHLEKVVDRFMQRDEAFTLSSLEPHPVLHPLVDQRGMLRTLLELMPDYEVDVERAERYRTLGINNGYVTMPARSQDANG